ncbi:MAG: dihydrolipoamide acetyltransferase family protein [Thermodesulfobacteriota bacterium]
MRKEFKLPDLGEGIHEGEILEVSVSPGDEVNEGDVIFVVETDKAAVEIPSPYSGKVEEVLIAPQTIVHVGEVMLVFEVAGGKEEAVKKTPLPPPAVKDQGAPAIKAAVPRKGPVPAAPATRKLARELGVDLAQVVGSGPAGLVSAEDVRAFAEQGETTMEQPPPQKSSIIPEPTAAATDLIAPPALPDFDQWGSVEHQPLRSVRRAIAKKMALSWSQIPHVCHQDLADITELETIRRKNRNEVQDHGGKLTITVFALKAAVAALEIMPRFNASLDSGREEIVLKKYFNLGIATDTEKGLLVPVIKGVDKKTMMELAVELPELAQKAREGKLSMEEMSGGTFTITNIGGIGGTGFQPIINYPEAAILGLGQARWQPVIRKDDDGKPQVQARLMLPLVLAFDHRILDGAEGARFMNEIKETFENPARIMFFDF